MSGIHDYCLISIPSTKPTRFRSNMLICLFLIFGLALADEIKQVKTRKARINSFELTSPNVRLTDDLLKRNAKKIRPVKHPNHTVEVFVLASLYQIVDVDQERNLLGISAYFDLWWTDPFLEWKPEMYENIYVTYLNAEDVWIPDLYLYHSVQGSTPLSVHHSAVQINSSGVVRVFIPFTAKAFCPINVKYFPFEELTCYLNFGSWSYKKQQIKYNVAETNVSLNDFYDNQEWVLEIATLNNNETEYNNSYFSEIFSAVTLTVFLKRGSFYYIFNLIVPSTMVTVVSVIGFHAAANSTQRRESKFRLGIMTLLSMGVLLLNVVDNMPKFSMVSTPGKRGSFSDVPLLGLYYLSLIVIISLCTCTSSFFVTLETYALQNPNNFPNWLKWLTCSWSCGKPKKNGKYVHVEPKNSPLFDADEFGSSETHRQNNHMQQTQLDQAHFIGTLPPPLNQNKPRKIQSADDVMAMNRNFDRLAETCREVLNEIRQIRSDVAKPKNVESKPNPNLLTKDWDILICRVEAISLFIYLFAIALSLFMFFHYDWY